MGHETRPGEFAEHDDEQVWLEAPADRRVFDEHVLDRPIASIRLRPAVIVDAGCVLESAVRQMREKRVGAAIVTRGGVLAGILTERDLLRRVVLGEMDPRTVRVEQIMRPSPEFLTPEHPLAYALKAMSQGGFRHVPLVDSASRPVGIISVRDIVDVLAEIFHDKVVTLPPTPDSAIAQKREGG